MTVDEYGTVGYSQQEVIDYLRINPNFDITGLFLIDGEQYENARIESSMDNPEREPYLPPVSIFDKREYDFSVEDYHKELQKFWLMSEKYSELDIETYLLNKCNTDQERKRVKEELELYKKFDLINLLRHLKYLKDIADENNIVWGVGRGSSCASYCLFLLKIHRVNSIEFDLDINDFLRK